MKNSRIKINLITPGEVLSAVRKKKDKGFWLKTQEEGAKKLKALFIRATRRYFMLLCKLKRG